MPTLTDDDVAEVKALVKAGKIEDARTLLEVCDDARAARLLAQLNERYPLQAQQIEADRPKSGKTSTFYAVIGVTIFIIGAMGFAVLAMRNNSADTQSDNIYARQTQTAVVAITDVLESICRTRFYDGVEDQKYTSSELKIGCHAAIQDTLSVWPDQISYCVNRVGLFASQLSECLTSQRVVILRAYIIQARDHPELVQTPDRSPTLDWDVLTEFPVTQSVR